MQENIQHNIQTNAQEKPLGTEHYIVGIGASAGGLEAINELFDNIPQGNTFSYVIIQHLSPDHKSLMDELLAKHTQMKIFIAEEGMPVLPNCIYLIPTKKNLTIKNNTLHLIDKQANAAPNFTIDIFFESLAKDKGEHAIGIVLSGTGTDGTKGIAAIKERGGLVIVQDPATAKFDGMPNSAIDSGNTDFILPPELMAEKILQYPNKEKLGTNLTNLDFNSDGEDILPHILNLIKENTSNDFTAYKRQTLERRIFRRMTEQRIGQPTEYLHYLRNNPDEVETLGNEFLIGVTKFFRDPIAFQIIQDKVVPDIVANHSENQVKVWVTACSTGEEAYSLAILFHEYLEKKRIDLDIKIFATDMDAKAVEFAAKGLYPPSIEKDVSEERLAKYFSKEGTRYCIGKHIRKMVIFAQHNLLKDPPFSKIDLVSCRNMLIYMKPELQKKVLSTFHFSLNLGGYLFLGSSESASALRDSLEIISKKWNIYRTITVNKNFIMGSSPLQEESEKKYQRKSPNVKPSVNSVHKKMTEVFNEAILEEFGYAAIFVNENYDFLQALGDYKRFLILPDKKLELNLLKIVPHQLSVALSIALRKAVRLHEKVVSSNIKVDYGEVVRIIDLVIKPYLDSDQFNEKFIFILLKEGKQSSKKERDEDVYENQVSLSRFSEIEAELKETKENLQTTVEELETSNEELQSSNEELISSNEELQSTNEELQSLNEELHTVNAEHQLKIKELSELNDDLNNYFRSTEIGQLFVDKDLLIRKYTPTVAKQINIIESDIGRPISHFSLNIKYTGLVEDITHVLNTQEIVEKEIELKDGQCFQMRVLPYIRQDKTVDGVVVTFVDISAIKNLNNMLEGVLNSSLNGILAFTNVKDKAGNIIDFEWVVVNNAAERMIGRSKEELIGHRLLEVLPGMKKQGIFDKYIEVAQEGSIYHGEHYYHYDGIDDWFEIVAIKIENGVAVTFANITEKKAAEDELMTAYEEVKETKERLIQLNNELEARVEERTRKLSESEERFRLVSLATNDAVWDWNLVTNELWWNEAFKEMFGYHEEDIQPGVESWFNRIHSDDRQRVMSEVYKTINEGKKKWIGEYRFLKDDGSYAFVYNRAYVLQDENEVPYRMLGSLVDLTNLKKAQDDLRKSNENLVKINTDLDNFVYTASHDLKSPIANLEGLISLLKQKLEAKADPKELRLAEMLDNSINKLKNTVKALTEITKVQKDANNTVELLSFQNILDDVQSDIQKMMEQHQVSLKADFNTPEIHYPKINLRSIFYNLLSNAIKYQSPDRKPEIHIRSEKQGEFVLLTFEDNGLGMNQTQLNKLFTMFKRFHTHVDGTGIGLYMVKRMVENRGGKIEVKSEEGVGTTFKIFLKE